MTNKKRVTIYLTDKMYEELKNQAKEAGLSMGSYVVYLLWVEKQVIKQR